MLLAGGWAHPGDDLTTAVQELLMPRQFEVAVVTDPADVVEAMSVGCDLLVVGACWFSMVDARYNDEQRADLAVGLSPAMDDALVGLRATGCPLLALHTAVICFDGAPLWPDWLGGTWNWETSWHPAPEAMSVRPVPNKHIDFREFTVTDELYQGLDVDGSAIVVAESDAAHQLVWLHETPVGRAAMNLLGHDRRSLDNADHRALNDKLLDWPFLGVAKPLG